MTLQDSHPGPGGIEGAQRPGVPSSQENTFLSQEAAFGRGCQRKPQRFFWRTPTPSLLRGCQAFRGGTRRRMGQEGEPGSGMGPHWAPWMLRPGVPALGDTLCQGSHFHPTPLPPPPLPAHRPWAATCSCSGQPWPGLAPPKGAGCHCSQILKTCRYLSWDKAQF